jgi:hypothetical protein
MEAKGSHSSLGSLIPPVSASANACFPTVLLWQCLGQGILHLIFEGYAVNNGEDGFCFVAPYGPGSGQHG